MESWDQLNSNSGLLRDLVAVYGWRFAFQWVGTLFRVVVGLAPYLILYRLISKLETTSSDNRYFGHFWVYVIGLGLCSISEQWLDSYLNWYATVHMGIPLSTQLSALIFAKSLKRKTVRTAEKNRDTDAETAKDDNESDKKGETVLRSRQAIVNLVGVDSRRIADFLAMHFVIINAVFKLVIYSGFLIQLIGYQPYLAGALAWALILPINSYATKACLKQEEKLMEIRDERLAMINEALLGIRQIKFSALEKEWSARILGTRGKELRTLRTVFSLDLVFFTCWIVSPILLTVVSLAVYAIQNGSLTPSVAFVAIGIFKSLETSLSVLPEFMSFGLDTMISVRRVGAYLKGPERNDIITRSTNVAFDHASIAWPVDDEAPKDRFILHDLNLSFPRGQLSVISGKTGSGKSLLLSALIGEADLLDGMVLMPPSLSLTERDDATAFEGNWVVAGSVAYVSQSPWLENATFRDNILFGLPFNEKRYNIVLDACALRMDLDLFEDGDQTELGANGVNLSGGQKWRVSLARSIYSRAEILLLDDIFSAVDAHVGRQIFENCIAGPICGGRTRILVTHHVALVQSKAKYLVELGGGTVLHSGLASNLADDGTLTEIRNHAQMEAETPTNEGNDPKTVVGSQEPSKPAAKKLVKDEKMAKGSITRHVYATYMTASGGLLFWIMCGLLYIAFEAGSLGRNWWLRVWTGNRDAGDEQGTSHATDFFAGSEAEHPLSFYLSIYAALALASGLIGSLRLFWAFSMTLRASQKLFERVLFNVFHTPLRWLDTVPVGRVLNRMTSDFDVVDTRLRFSINLFIGKCLAVIAVCVASTLVTPFILPLAAVLIISAGFIGKKYTMGARPMKRLESTSKSPIFELFNTTLAGISTLRAFQKEPDYIKRMFYFLDSSNTYKIHFWVFNRWMGIRLAVIGTVFTTCTGILIILNPRIDASAAGFAMTFALEFASTILSAIRAVSGIELDMNAVERVVEYSELEMESQDGTRPPAAWPASGSIEMKNVVVKYAEDSPSVLKGVSFLVKDNERVGIVGRTGAGKSSLTLALFRFLEAASGSITVDGLDISKIDIHSLRSRLTIIPQDPTLFSGTIRSNLDPFKKHTDPELYECLKRVHLIDSCPALAENQSALPESALPADQAAPPSNGNIFLDLSSGISESGGNLSQGQRQLLCIARAILRRPRIMVLDEATSAVDMSTDVLIQRSIREEFDNGTLLVIAHRLSTVADFDRILVLSEGAVAEFGSPRELWENEQSLFRDMCEHSGEKEQLEAIIVGNK